MFRIPFGRKNEIPTFFYETSPRRDAKHVDISNLGGMCLALTSIDLWRTDSSIDDSWRNSLPHPFDFFDHWGNVTNATVPAALGIFATILLNGKRERFPTAKRELIVNGVLSFVLASGIYTAGEYGLQELNKHRPPEKRTPADPTDIAYGTLSALAISGFCRRQTIKLAVQQHKATKSGPPPPDGTNPLNQVLRPEQPH